MSEEIEFVQTRSRNILFVCSANKLRSPTAEAMYKGRSDLKVKSAGISASATIPITSELVDWAEYIFVMDEEHSKYLRRKFYNRIRSKRIYNLQIPDEYEFMDSNLMAILADCLRKYIGEPYLMIDKI